MTLKEKFKNVDELDKTWNQILEQQVKIADEYAIEFAEWCNELRLYGEGYYEKNLKELLEIYKKEKGL
ncbi:hypothetical protein [Flavobacterium sp.]|uniref:hypothetical protein n=1 Tax=Flavobacterium sp. TaxID=239 RepID=UPI0025D36456|nr:hypothetical protein [Flavobacterium sp.]